MGLSHEKTQYVLRHDSIYVFSCQSSSGAYLNYLFVFFTLHSEREEDTKHSCCVQAIVVDTVLSLFNADNLLLLSLSPL